MQFIPIILLLAAFLTPLLFGPAEQRYEHERPSDEDIDRVTQHAKDTDCIYTGSCYDYDKAWFTQRACGHQLKCYDRMIIRGQIPTRFHRKQLRLKGKRIHVRSHENYTPTLDMKTDAITDHLGVRIIRVPGHVICEKIHNKGGE